jgi:glucose-1-phosphate cytidylyltransferase
MKCVILAGGRGTRISEESHLRPKPMIEIGTRPILWHIMKHYSHYGVNDFIICLGYRGYMIKEYFANYFLHGSDVTVELASNRITFHNCRSEPWRVTLVDTGESTATGGRVLRAREYLEAEPFFVTYGDGVANVDLGAQLAFHRNHGRLATMTVVRPPARFGSAAVKGDAVVGFIEKPQASEGLINGGFFVFSPGVLDFIDGDDTPLETTPLERLVAKDELRAWRHEGFWQPMDTLREKELLEAIWSRGDAPWKVWP